MALRHRARLILYGREGAGQTLTVPQEELQGLLRSLLREGGAPAQLRWQRTGSLCARPLLDRWIEQGLFPGPTPRMALLRSAASFGTGLGLHLETAWPEEELVPLAERLLRLIRSRGKVTEVAVEAAHEEAAAAHGRGPRERARRSGRRRRRTESEPVFELRQAAQRGPAGEGASDGEGLRAEDLPWLLPGEQLSSARGGSYRLKRVLDQGRRFLLRNREGDFLSVSAQELLRDFRRPQA